MELKFRKQKGGDKIIATQRPAGGQWLRCKAVNDKPHAKNWFWARDWLIEKEFDEIPDNTAVVAGDNSRTIG